MAKQKLTWSWIAHIFLVYVLTLNLLTAQDILDCVESCGGWKAYHATDKNGSKLCATMAQTGNALPADPCVLECMQLEPDTDQTECFCKMCRQGFHLLFCPAPEAGGISPENCEDFVCSGYGKRVKHYGYHCIPDKAQQYDKEFDL